MLSGRSVAIVCQVYQTLGLDAVMEGVETEEERSFARLAGADRIQGYLIGKPQPPKKAWISSFG